MGTLSLNWTWEHGDVSTYIFQQFLEDQLETQMKKISIAMHLLLPSQKLAQRCIFCFIDCCECEQVQIMHQHLEYTTKEFKVKGVKLSLLATQFSTTPPSLQISSLAKGVHLSLVIDQSKHLLFNLVHSIHDNAVAQLSHKYSIVWGSF